MKGLPSTVLPATLQGVGRVSEFPVSDVVLAATTSAEARKDATSVTSWRLRLTTSLVPTPDTRPVPIDVALPATPET